MEVAGDTRFDRVYQLAKNPVSFPEIAAFAGKLPMMIAGSTWPKDEEILANAFQSQQKHCKLIIAPHEIHESHLLTVEECFKDFKQFAIQGFRRQARCSSTDN